MCLSLGRVAAPQTISLRNQREQQKGAGPNPGAFLIAGQGSWHLQALLSPINRSPHSCRAGSVVPVSPPHAGSWGLKLQGFPNLCPHLGGLESSLLLQGDLEAQPDLASGHNSHHSPRTALASLQLEVLRVLALVGF